MSEDLSLLIIKELLGANEPLMANDLAEHLNISRRTFFKYVKLARELCYAYNAELCNEKNKGYYIINSSELKNSINKLDLPATFNREGSKLFIEYCLLSENDYIHINELEEILHFSRPTIYKILDEIKEICREYDIELVVERKGVIILAGEKRRRRAIRSWMKQTRDIIRVRQKQNIATDYFKFEKCIKEFEMFDKETIKEIFNGLSTILDLNYSKYEEESTYDFLNIIFKRVSNNCFTSLSVPVGNRMHSFYEIECKNVHDFILKYGIDLPDAEIVYLVASLLVSGQDINKNYAIEDGIKDKVQNDKLKEIKDYILSVLNLNETSIDNLMEDISSIIQREFILRVKDEHDIDSEHYRETFENYNITRGLAIDIFNIINRLFDVQYNERTVANINFACLSAIEMNKRKIKTVVFHNCDYYEYKYLLYRLQKLPYISVVYSTDSEKELNFFFDNSQIDLVISTTDIAFDKINNLITISKNLTNKETEMLLKTSESLFQKINLEEIYIKDKKANNDK